MFDFLDPIIGVVGDVLGGIGGFAKDVYNVVSPFASAAAPYASAYMSGESVRDTNESNERIALNANSASAAQAQLNRDFQQASADKQMAFQAQQIEGQQDFTAGQAAREMGFQERMSNTSYQRAVQDLNSAGLNPMLSLMKGGASTPNGAMGTSGAASGASASGSMGQTHTATMQPALAQAINTGMAAARLESDLKTQEADRDLIKANADKVRQETVTSSASAGQMVASTQKIKHETALVLAQYDNARQELHKLQSDTARSEFIREKLQPLEERLMSLQATLSALEVPGMQNRASAAGTWWGKNVSPYIKDFTAGAVGSGAIGLKLPR